MYPIHVKVSGKVAVCRNRYLISSNSDYSLVFTFDSDWDDVPVKTARVIFDDSCVDLPFSGDTVALPKIPPCESLAVGVFSDTLATTAAELGCILSVADTEHEVLDELTVDQYAMLLSLINAASGRRVGNVTRSDNNLLVSYTDGTSASVPLAGPAGKSAYQSAVDSGFQGDEAAWLVSLKGDTGPKGDKGDRGDPFTYGNLTAADADKVPKVNHGATGFELVDPDEIGVKSWNDLQDRPFGDFTETPAPIEINSGALSNTTVTINAFVHHRVTPSFLSAEDLVGATIFYSIDGVAKTKVIQAADLYEHDDSGKNEFESIWDETIPLIFNAKKTGRFNYFYSVGEEESETYYSLANVNNAGLYFAYSDNPLFEEVHVTKLQLQGETTVVPLPDKYLPDSVKFTTDSTLTLRNGVLGVNTTDSAAQDNTQPITSAGVYTQLGNIEALLQTI